ncbi:MAG: FAD/NAD(P)-binding protein, partial [Pandoraea sp.]|nr:FAD/NAD(P)-binding protein [Pandoraea sp.]
MTDAQVPAGSTHAAHAADDAHARRFDLAIVGAGPVGTALALLLAQRAPQLRIALVDARGAQAGYDD